MLLLLFKIKDEHFAIDTAKIVEVVPYLLPKKIQHTPNYVVGLINYRTKPIPLIDLSLMLENCPSRKLLSTRIIMINADVTSSKSRVLGLLAENVTETISPPKDWQAPSPQELINGTHTIDSSFINHQKLIHWFSPEHMLPHNDIENIYRDISGL